MDDPKNKELLRLKVIWKKKKFTTDFNDFLTWFDTVEKKCHYCDITEGELNKLIDENKIFSKRLRTRGRKLEFERRLSEENYQNLDNLSLCCYWCNNAKTDTFSEDEFLLIGKEIKKIWQKRLSQ